MSNKLLADGETMFSFEKNRTDSQFRNKLVYFRKGKLIEVYSGMIVKL